MLMTGAKWIWGFQLISLQKRSETQKWIKEFNLAKKFPLLIRDAPRGTNNFATFLSRFYVRLI